MTAPDDATALPASPAPVVMKFGGSSVADADRLRAIAETIEARARARPVVVVVSAMGDTTDRLVAQARALADAPAPRELDMLMTTGERTSMALLAIALGARGVSAISLTGSQCGIITDHRHGRARVVEVRPFRIGDELALGNVVIVGGFAGVSYKREVTTLGRGGSDTTAVALAAALGADCEIYSDVDGIYSADPRAVPSPRRLDEVSFESMRALSRAGAKVLHGEAVRLAEAADIRVFARAADGRPGQTIVTRTARERAVVGVACDAVRPLTVLEAPALDPMLAALAEAGARDRHARRDVGGAWRCAALLSSSADPNTDRILTTLADALRPAHLVVGDPVALVSVVGASLEDRPDLAAAASAALRDIDVEILGAVSDSRSLGFLVAPARAHDAQRALHDRLIA